MAICEKEKSVTGAIDELRLVIAARIEGRKRTPTVRDLEAVLILLTAAADRAEEANL